MGLVAASAVLALRAGTEARRGYARAAALVAAFVFGAAVRGAFLASAGSWDTEYWKAWMLRAADHGVTRVYGDPGAVPPAHLLAQMSGDEELWQVEFAGRRFVVDYPPLAMALWRWSWWIVSRGASGLDPPEARNVAVKLPSVLGDVGAVRLGADTFGAGRFELHFVPRPVVGDRDAVVALGSEEAEEILRQARLQSEQMVSDTDVYRLATERAVEVPQAAAREAASLRAETDAYVEAKLANFELTLERTLDMVRNGRAQLSGGHSHRLGDDSDVQDIVLSEHFEG